MSRSRKNGWWQDARGLWRPPVAGGGVWPETFTVLSPLVVLSPFSLGGARSLVGGAGSAGSQTWPAANRALYFPVLVERPFIAVKLFVVNGTAVSGNIDVGIYDAFGTKLISAGSTAQAGVSATQEFDIADTALSPGLFYLALALDNTTGTTHKRNIGNARYEALVGCLQQATAFPLPATATFAAMATDNVPFFGATSRVVV